MVHESKTKTMEYVSYNLMLKYTALPLLNKEEK